MIRKSNTRSQVIPTKARHVHLFELGLTIVNLLEVKTHATLSYMISFLEIVDLIIMSINVLKLV